MTEPLLRIEDLTVRLGSGARAVRPVDGVSLTINRGETFALLGESGCGKSMTALSILQAAAAAGRSHHRRTCLARRRGPDRACRSPACARIRGRRIAMIFQEPMTSLNPVLTIGDQIGEVLQAAPRPARARGARPRAGAAGCGRHPGCPTPQRRISAPAVRRHEAARNDRDRAGRRTRPADRRRADHGTGCHHPGTGAGAAAGIAAGHAHGDPADHP